VEEAMTDRWAPLPPSPATQLPYYGAPLPTPPIQKPSAFYKAVGIIQMVLGVCGVLYSLFSMVTTAVATSWAPTVMSMYDKPTLAFLYLHGAVSVGTGAALLATGVGVVRAKRWGRYVGVGYAATSLLNTFGSTAVQLIFIQPRLYAHMGALGGAHGLEAFGVVSALFGLIFASVIPVITLVVLLRSGAKDELDG
jgi:hypothetical protein